jgi:ABC-2 type transport system ATP-binding protein
LHDHRTKGPIVNVRGLTKRYGNQLAVEGLTFALEAGTITGFLGPNGAGKSTTMRLLLGLAQPTAGEALLFGRPLRRPRAPRAPSGRRARVR